MNVPTHQCPACGTQYFAPGVCDWDGVTLVDLTEQRLLSIDLAYARDKASGALDDKRDQRALQEQQQRWGTGL
jgi:hypothetical protein